MLLLGHVIPEKWYTVNETGEILGWKRDTIIRLIESGYLQAMVKPRAGNRLCREYLCRMIQGCEIIRFVKDNLSIPEPRQLRRRMRMM